MDAERLLGLVEAACRNVGTRWAVIGGMAMNAYGHARTTLDFDIAAEEGARKALLSHLAAEGFEILNDVEGFSNLLHADPALGRLDVLWLEGTTADRVFSRLRHLPGPGGRDVPVPAPEHLVAMKVRSIQSRPTRVFRDGADLEYLLRSPGLDDNEARGFFERAGLLDLYDRVRRPR
jgi:hypothetical protein